ncbi:MAG: CDP-alcohol phosphatidyltransferase family protein [Marivibrio sp.]|uniref:CDP-alcohol phosphatidyltransferase family protein n=1 Tax=Marivibrio sp. TaxID=2039719 RepID=UPI0032EBB4C5
MRTRILANALSLSRAPLGLAFLHFYEPTTEAAPIAAAIFLLAFATDIADGRIARLGDTLGVFGRLWDSLGDKAFYIAVILALLEHGLMFSAVAWGLLYREVVLYITRLIYIKKIKSVEETRFFTNWHGYFLYIIIISSLSQPYASDIVQERFLLNTVHVASFGALIFGWLSIYAYLRLPDD